MKLDLNKPVQTCGGECDYEIGPDDLIDVPEVACSLDPSLRVIASDIRAAYFAALA